MLRPMAIVHRLSESLANQIAAGEVVERPAAAAKELVENAIDAGAKRVEVRLEDGGRTLLEVVDDGSGMSREDALLALERHTTSKLSTADDLFDIRTFGFRGEALPSIASVSRFTLTTRTADDAEATRIVVEGGRIASVDVTGAPKGTRIQVADLFFNVPARLTFLKQKATEQGHVLDWMTRLALANPSVAFHVLDGKRTLLQAEATGDLRARIGAVLGREVHDVMHRVEAERDGLHVHGYSGGPGRTVGTSRELHFFVNGRYVRDKGLYAAVHRAYDGVLPAGHSPAAVLFIDVPRGEVDVNAHPQKLEVRFSNAKAVFDTLYRALADMLVSSPWLVRPAARGYALNPVSATTAPAGTPASTTLEPAPLTLTPPPSPIERPPSPRQGSMLGELFKPSPGREKVAAAIGLYRDASLVDIDVPLLGRDIAGVFPTSTPVATPSPRPTLDTPLLRFSELRPLGQVHRTYLVCESPEGLLLLDQHAAHERVLYEKYRRERAGEVVGGQPLLVPVSLDASPAEAATLEAALPDLAELGFEVEPFGGTTFAIKAVPKVFLDAQDLGRTVRELAHELRQLGTTRTADAMEEALLARMSCHAAVRAGHAMTNEEIVSLLQQLDGTPFHAQCPHGRPVVVRFDTGALKEMFGRTYEGASKEGLRERFG